MKLRKDVQLETEILIKKIKGISEEKISDINKYKKECLSMDRSKIDQTFEQEMEKFSEQCKLYLENVSTEEMDIVKATE